MRFDSLSHTQLVHLYDDLTVLCELPDDSRYFIGDATREIRAVSAVIISDERLKSLIQKIRAEAYTELARRFSVALPSETPTDPSTPAT